MLPGKRFSLFALNKNRHFFYFYKFRLSGPVDKIPETLCCPLSPGKGLPLRPRAREIKKSACIVMQAPLSVTPEGLEPSTQ